MKQSKLDICYVVYGLLAVSFILLFLVIKSNLKMEFFYLITLDYCFIRYLWKKKNY